MKIVIDQTLQTKTVQTKGYQLYDTTKLLSCLLFLVVMLFFQGESVTPTRSQSGPSHRRHVRTIQEVRTTITRVITDVYYEDGREVDRKVVEVRSFSLRPTGSISSEIRKPVQS